MTPAFKKRSQTPGSDHYYRCDGRGHYSKDCPIISQMAEMDVHDSSPSETDLSPVEEVSEAENDQV